MEVLERHVLDQCKIQLPNIGDGWWVSSPCRCLKGLSHSDRKQMSELEERSVEIYHTESQRQNQWNAQQNINIGKCGLERYLIWKTKAEERDNWEEEIFEVTIAKNVPKLKQTVILQGMGEKTWKYFLIGKVLQWNELVFFKDWFMLV